MSEDEKPRISGQTRWSYRGVDPTASLDLSQYVIEPLATEPMEAVEIRREYDVSELVYQWNPSPDPPEREAGVSKGWVVVRSEFLPTGAVIADAAMVTGDAGDGFIDVLGEFSDVEVTDN